MPDLKPNLYIEQALRTGDWSIPAILTYDPLDLVSTITDPELKQAYIEGLNRASKNKLDVATGAGIVAMEAVID